MTDRLIEGCRVCGAAETVYLGVTFNEHSQTSSIRHCRCSSCGSVFVANEVDGEELGVAYGTIDNEQYYEATAAETGSKMATAARFLAQAISCDRKTLDIGTGNGSFVELLVKQGFSDVSAHEIQGSDLSRIAPIAARIYQDFDYHTIPDGRFAAVTLLDVLEHVIEPAFLVTNCARVLEPGGLFYCHTPVVTRLDRLMHKVMRVPLIKRVGTMWQRGRTSIFHLENYTERSLRMLLERAGFEEIEIEIRNELSWPVSMYVETYLLAKQGLPRWLAPLLTPFLYPFLATDFFNANKAIVSARKKR